MTSWDKSVPRTEDWWLLDCSIPSMGLFGTELLGEMEKLIRPQIYSLFDAFWFCL